jgi:NAD(P)-dependent dehydrogenase (short-subunit alcohol dehydrogenase family)
MLRVRTTGGTCSGGEGEDVSEIRFDDRVVLVTGSGRGLGAAYARAFADRGASVVVHDAGVAADGSGFDPSVADAVAGELGPGAAACHEDLSSEEGCRRTVEFAVERFGRLDVVVHNAGLLVWEELDVAAQGWEMMRRVNVDATFHVTRFAFPIMKGQGFGRFVFTTSGRAMSAERTRPGLAAYATGKMAHFALMVVTACEGKPHGIFANAISPAAATRMLRRRVEPGELDPEQVAPGVVYLGSDRCTFSGKVLEAAGGEFSVARWISSSDVDFGREPVEPETLAERWTDIEGVHA